MGGHNYFLERFGLIWNSYLTFCIIFFIFDIIFTLNTGYYEKGVVVTDRTKIAKNYIFNYFLIDLLGFIPLICEIS